MNLFILFLYWLSDEYHYAAEADLELLPQLPVSSV